MERERDGGRGLWEKDAGRALWESSAGWGLWGNGMHEGDCGEKGCREGTVGKGM